MIGLIQLYLVAVAISLDTFAASLALGTRVPPRGWIRVAIVFAISGGLFPLVGMGIGVLASGFLAQVAGALGALVLAGLGGWFLHGALLPSRAPGGGVPPTPEGVTGAPPETAPDAGLSRAELLAPGTPPDLLVGRPPPEADPVHLRRKASRREPGTLPLGGLVLLAMGLSSDNLLVGLGLGLQGGGTVLLGVFTAFSVFCATLTGLWLGRLKKAWFGRAAEGVAGVLLLLLAGYLLLGG